MTRTNAQVSEELRDFIARRCSEELRGHDVDWEITLTMPYWKGGKYEYSAKGNGQDKEFKTNDKPIGEKPLEKFDESFQKEVIIIAEDFEKLLAWFPKSEKRDLLLEKAIRLRKLGQLTLRGR